MGVSLVKKIALNQVLDICELNLISELTKKSHFERKLQELLISLIFFADFLSYALADS